MTELLVRHAEQWAAQKKRTLDPELLAQALDLRRTHDDDPDGWWPPGSADRLLLVLWPAYGRRLEDPGALASTLDTWWGFLRATGRMSADSASPAELRKEARRCVPRMAAAYDDPGLHSQGRVLLDFGRSIGLDVDGAESPEELQAVLDQVQTAWNALPQEERIRRMPDPSPRGRRGAGGVDFRPGDPGRSVEQAKASGFVRACLDLRAWVGEGRAVTQAGNLRPAVAREAYQHLDLWPWEREYETARRRSYGMSERGGSAEIDRALADAALHGWSSAADCLPLDRLWLPAVEAELIEVRSTKAVALPLPASDDAWRNTALSLVANLCLRLPSSVTDALGGLLVIPQVRGSGVPMADIRAWWDDQLADELGDMFGEHWQASLDLTMFHFADCALWQVSDDDVLTLTDFGRDFSLVFVRMVEHGALD